MAQPLVLGIRHAVSGVGSEGQHGGPHAGNEDLVGRDARTLFASVGSEAVVAVQSDIPRLFTSNQDGGEPITATHRVGAGLHHVSSSGWKRTRLCKLFYSSKARRTISG